MSPIARRPAAGVVAAFAYSEWLDQQGLLKPGDVHDERTHENLVDEFMACEDWWREDSSERAP